MSQKMKDDLKKEIQNLRAEHIQIQDKCSEQLIDLKHLLGRANTLERNNVINYYLFFLLNNNLV